MKLIKTALILSALALISACKTTSKKSEIEVIASSENQWTGIAVSKEGRIFVNFPTWSDNVPIKVAEIVDGQVMTYPDKIWNNRFVAVQSVVIDKKNRLWVLDTNNPRFHGVKDGSPMLYSFDLSQNKLIKAYRFAPSIYKNASYFNDVRIDTKREIAYMTDSGDGAIIMLNLVSGESTRFLDNHKSTESEVDHLICDGVRWQNSVHADGIGLSPDTNYLYYAALTGHTLYRVPTKALINHLKEIESYVEKVADIPATDGILFDKDGTLYLGGLEDHSINMLKNSKVEKLAKDPLIRWPDSFAMDKEGNLYTTTSQIHLPEGQRKAYQILKLTP